jgi:hypothetical protein
MPPGYDKRQTDRWLAPALNCLPLRTEVTTSNESKVKGRLVEMYLTIKEGEPDSHLFEIPQDYVERTPSEAMMEAARRFPNNPQWALGGSDLTPFDNVHRNYQRAAAAESNLK